MTNLKSDQSVDSLITHSVAGVSQRSVLEASEVRLSEASAAEMVESTTPSSNNA